MAHHYCQHCQWRLKWFVLLVLPLLILSLPAATLILLTPSDAARTSVPVPQYKGMPSNIVSFNLTTKGSATIDLEMQLNNNMQFFPTLVSGQATACVTQRGAALPLSNRPDFTIDMNIMLPHKDDDIFACSSNLRTQNEFNQTYTDSWILMEQSSCTDGRYLFAVASGARGVIVAGCSPDPPYNCDETLQQLMVLLPIHNSTIIGITYEDGKRIMDYLNAKKAQANGAPIPKDTLVMTIKSAGPLVASERQALIKIMTNTSMTSFVRNPNLDFLPYWKKDLFEDLTWDPCLNRTQGIWCEGNNIVMVALNYHFWALNTGVIPEEIADLTEVRYISVMYNLWNGAIPQRYCELKKLKVLWLGSQLAAGGFTSLPDCDWPAMEDFWIDHNSLTALPPSISKWYNLKRLYAGQNRLTVLPSFANLTNLEVLDVSINAITGSIPAFSSVAPLKVIGLGTNRFSGQIPANAFDGLAQLEVLDLNSNRITGTLPKMVGCTNLRILDLSSQRNLSQATGGFTDDFPTSYYSLHKLQELYLQENSLTNTQVLTMSAMLSLTILDLSHNNYTLINPRPDSQPYGTVADLLRYLVSPSLTILRLNHNSIYGTLSNVDPTFLQSIRKLYLNDNRITTLWADLFSTGLIHVDLSNNEIKSDSFINSSPSKDFEYLNLQGNPKLTYNDIPSWADPQTTRVQRANQSYACQSLGVNTAASMTFLVDPTFYKYKYCECQAGTFGKAPLCNVVPNNADLNPFSVISSKEIGTSFPTLIQSAGGIGSNLTETSTQNITTYAQAFSDSMYGENRLVQGVMTSWSVDLTNLYSDDVDSLIAQGINLPSTPTVYRPSQPSDVQSHWTPVRSITVRLHISGTLFTQFDDVLTIFSGGADLKGDRILTIRGTDKKLKELSSPYTSTPEYQHKYHTSISAISDPRLVEVQVFSSITTVQFTSRQTSGLHFYATYSYDFVCPSGYFYDRITNPQAPKCRENYEIYSVSSSLRSTVHSVSAVAMALVAFCTVILGFYWNHGVFRAASRSFMLLILVMMESMSLGAMLYAAVPDVHLASTGSAVCIGRAWLTCLPLAAILSIVLAKNRRMWAIFGATKLQVKTHSDLDLLITVLLISAVQCILLAVFSGLPLSKPVLERGKGSLSSMLVMSCSQESGFMSWIGAEIAFIAALMLPTAYLGFKTRNLPSQFNESAHLQNALIVLMFFMVIIIPLDVFIQDDPGSTVLLQGLGQSFLTIMLTLIIFGPKIWFVTQSSDIRGHTQTPLSSPNVDNSGKRGSSTPVTQPQNPNKSLTSAAVVTGRNRQGSQEQHMNGQLDNNGRQGCNNVGKMKTPAVTTPVDPTRHTHSRGRSFLATGTPIRQRPSISESISASATATDEIQLQVTVTKPEIDHSTGDDTAVSAAATRDDRAMYESPTPTTPTPTLAAVVAEIELAAIQPSIQ